MKSVNKYITLIFTILVVVVTSCDKDIEVGDYTNEDVMEFLWSEIDTKYCFFEYKKDSIKNWNDVRTEYREKVRDTKDNYELFAVLSEMVCELKDSHVNLYSPFDISRNKLHPDAPINYDPYLLKYSDRYLAKDTRQVGGFQYKKMEDGKVGYMKYSSFESTFSERNLDEILFYFKDTKGLIIDVRGNGGGYINNVEKLVSRFIDEKTLTSYRQYKNGPGHNDFSKPEAIYVTPSDRVRYLGTIVVLTNKECYSATNDFVQAMKGLKNVLIIGSKTGGGSGVPVSSELPNGWTLRMSANPYYDKNMKCTEFGIEPDIQLELDTQRAYSKKEDSIIEYAVTLISKLD